MNYKKGVAHHMEGHHFSAQRITAGTFMFLEGEKKPTIHA